jgi:hypothetical protein
MTPEEKDYQTQKKEEYEERATTLVNESLTEKYGDGVIVKTLNLTENTDFSYGFSDEPYQTVATGQAELNGFIFDYYLRWNIDNNPNAFVCCDNKQKDELLDDLHEYFYSVYGKEPYMEYYAVFPSLGYEFGKADGMLKEKYDGNVENFLANSGGIVNIALAYKDIDTVQLGESSEANEFLLNARKIYVFNTKNDSLALDDLIYVIVRGNVEKIMSDDILEYVRYKNRECVYWSASQLNAE